MSLAKIRFACIVTRFVQRSCEALHVNGPFSGSACFLQCHAIFAKLPWGCACNRSFSRSCAASAVARNICSAPGGLCTRVVPFADRRCPCNFTRYLQSSYEAVPRWTKAQKLLFLSTTAFFFKSRPAFFPSHNHRQAGWAFSARATSQICECVQRL